MLETEFYHTLAQDILSEIKGPFGGKEDAWSCPWHGFSKLPANPYTGFPFQGVNALKLWSVYRKRGLSSHFWASEASWKYHGAVSVNQDKGVVISIPVLSESESYRWDKTSRRHGPLGKDAQGGIAQKFLGFKTGLVYNFDDVIGCSLPKAEPPSLKNLGQESLDKFLIYQKNNGPSLLFGGNRAFYSLSHDRITLPEREAFRSDIDFASVLFHECAHSTASPARLNRKFGAFGTKVYAKEELVAELAAAFLCASLGFSAPGRKDHVLYIREWISVLKYDEKSFFWAVSKAMDATRFLMRYFV